MGGGVQFAYRLQPVLVVIFSAEQNARQAAMRFGNRPPFIQGRSGQHFKALVTQCIEQFIELLAGDIAAPAVGIDDQNREMQVLEHAASCMGSISQCCAATGYWQARCSGSMAPLPGRGMVCCTPYVVLCRETECEIGSGKPLYR